LVSASTRQLVKPPLLQVSTSRQTNGENRRLREPCILFGDFRGHAVLIGHLLCDTSVDSERWDQQFIERWRQQGRSLLIEE
jgi:hypothetical protein